jgi:hypothetical protein
MTMNETRRGEIEIRMVHTRRDRRAFLMFPWQIYRNDPLWVPPLLPERAKAMDPERGAFFKRGEAEFFLAMSGGEVVGTICAGEDPPTNASRGTRECIFGFFECIDDPVVAHAMLDKVKAWAKARRLNALWGPFNLDYEDGYGVLVEGRDRPPALMCGHTPPYYQDLIESYGFRPARGDNLAFAIDLDATTMQAQRLLRLADRVRKRGRFEVRGADLEHWSDEIDRIHHLLNTSLVHLPDHIGWQREALEATLTPFRDLADPELVLFLEKDGETIGWFPGIANLNEALIHANGLRYPWDYLRLWWHMRQQPDCLAVKSVLIHPDYWNSGASLLLFVELGLRAIEKGYKWLDLSITSEDNPHTPILAENMGAEIYKRYRVYRLKI